MYKVSKKTGNKGLQTLVHNRISKIDTNLKKSTYNFRFNGPNCRLVDIKITIYELMKYPTGVSKFGKNLNILCLHNFVLGSTELFVIGFSKLRLGDLKITFNRLLKFPTGASKK